MRLVLSVLKFRASSLCWHTWGWLGPTALLVSACPDDRAQGLQHLKLCSQAVEWCKRQGGKCMELADWSFLNGGVMASIVRLAAKDQFSKVDG